MEHQDNKVVSEILALLKDSLKDVKLMVGKDKLNAFQIQSDLDTKIRKINELNYKIK